MGKVCKKCGYERLPTDDAPAYECPKCGAVYAKVDAFLKRKAEDEEKKKAEEEKRAHQLRIKSEAEENKKIEEAKAEAARTRIVTRTYTGSQNEATSLFQQDAAKMAGEGYFPTSQSWAPGQYGCGAFLLALILSFVLICLIVFVYMLIVKPPGTLSVTYELKDLALGSQDNGVASGHSKVCPRCAENIKAAAIVCRYCGYEFEQT